MCKLMKIKSTFIILIAILTFNYIKAQNNFWQLTEKPSIISEDGQKVLASMESYPDNLGMQYARVNNFSSATQEGGLIKLSLKDKQEELVMQIDYCEYVNDEDFSFHASCEQGSLSWYCKEGGRGGVLDLFTELYTIYPISRDEVVIIQLSMQPTVENGSCDVDKKSERQNPNDIKLSYERSISFCGLDCGSATIDVLALITPNAQSWLSSQFGVFSSWWAYQTTHNMNFALSNSSISGKNIRVRTIYYNPPSGLISLTMKQTSDEMAINSSILQLKSQYKADIVVLLTKNFTSPVGFANSITPSDFTKNCVVEINKVDETRYTFAHEIAHQLGADHSLDDPSGFEEKCAHGQMLALTGGVTRGTIMGTNNIVDLTTSQVNRTRVQHFSNPNVTFSGVATGKKSDGTLGDQFSNNASIIRGSFCTVANNMPNPSLSITGITSSGVNTKFLVATIYQPQLGNLSGIPGLGILGTPPYTYKWEASDSFSGPFQLLNSSGLSVSYNVYQGNILKFTITGSDGYAVSGYKTVYVGMNHGKNAANGSNNIFTDILREGNNKKLVFYPNPVDDDLQIIVPQDNLSKVDKIEIINQDGSIVMQTSNITENSTLDISTLKDGIYFIKYMLDDKIISDRVLVNH